MEIVEIAFTRLIPPMLFLMMFGMGVSLTLADFRRVIRQPRAALIGLAGQLLLLPALAFGLVLIFQPPPAVAAGALLLAACPGGITSNGYSFVGRGDVGLSVTLTAVTSIVTIATIPLIVWFALGYFLGESEAPELPVLNILKALISLTALPIGLGMIVRHRWPDWAGGKTEFMRWVSFALLLVVITTTTLSSLESLAANLPSAGLLALTLNLSSMAAGFGAARLARLPDAQVRTITFEVGVQNLSLAALIAVTVLGRGELAILAVVYALVMKTTALVLLFVWRRRDAQVRS